MKTRFWFDREKCAACYACQIACMDQNDTARGGTPLRTVYTEEGMAGGLPRCFGVSRSCLHCADPACIPACSAGCFRRDEETGMVLCDSAECVGCRSCAAACPHGAIQFENDRPRKCEGCAEWVRRGLTPACVLNCPTGAIGIYERERSEA